MKTAESENNLLTVQKKHTVRECQSYHFGNGKLKHCILAPIQLFSIRVQINYTYKSMKFVRWVCTGAVC